MDFKQKIKQKQEENRKKIKTPKFTIKPGQKYDRASCYDGCCGYQTTINDTKEDIVTDNEGKYSHWYVIKEY